MKKYLVTLLVLTQTTSALKVELTWDPPTEIIAGTNIYEIVSNPPPLLPTYNKVGTVPHTAVVFTIPNITPGTHVYTATHYTMLQPSNMEFESEFCNTVTVTVPAQPPTPKGFKFELQISTNLDDWRTVLEYVADEPRLFVRTLITKHE